MVKKGWKFCQKWSLCALNFKGALSYTLPTPLRVKYVDMVGFDKASAFDAPLICEKKKEALNKKAKMRFYKVFIEKTQLTNNFFQDCEFKS